MMHPMRKLVWLALAACGSSSSGDSPQPAPAPAPTPAPAAKPAPAPAAPPDAAPIKEAGSTSLAPTLPGYTFGYSGILTPDAPRFGESKSTGVSIADDQMGFHIWKGTIGDARTELEAQASIDGGKYVETKVSEKEVDYTIGGHTGMVVLVAGLLCGSYGIPPQDLDVYRKICSTLTKS
jgi:hypothetical protein